MTPALPPIAVTPVLDDLFRQHAAVAIGVSGGKDSQAAAIATFDYLDRIGHVGPRRLIHADLGIVEWSDSLPVCERLAERLGVELVVVRREQGGLMERWESRWRGNVARYEDLSTVTLVPCWSTPAMRFCTSELKTSRIHAALKRGFQGLPIISVTGVRRQESHRRARAEIAERKASNGIWTGRPILDWSEGEVFDAPIRVVSRFTRRIGSSGCRGNRAGSASCRASPILRPRAASRRPTTSFAGWSTSNAAAPSLSRAHAGSETSLRASLMPTSATP
ncbi:phosphoadenosine phosphosulfate reductase family protein [Bosea sp. AK1]|uniref:phosphoadenosine phosphosulfate reductase domain-containing protein n=1 Tax=Bosea sp. AK1 TaxID=2587160 RepID=UPI0020C01D91|nr:phosphoadenosine phosphosulfate reductase family protein [Bosea sp. AK1]